MIINIYKSQDYPKADLFSCFIESSNRTEEIQEIVYGSALNGG